MRNFFTLVRQEWRILLYSPSTYWAAVLFTLFMGAIYLFILQDFSGQSQEETPAEVFFKLFWLPVFFVVPLLTMRSIAEERRLGTLSTTLTASVSGPQLVMSKFVGAYSFYLGLWALTILFPVIARFVLPHAQLEVDLFDQSSWIGGFLFVALSGSLFISVGIFASSLTRSQLVAGMLSFTILFVIVIGGKWLSVITIGEGVFFAWLVEPLQYLRSFQHLDEFSRGLVDSRPLVYYTSASVLLLGMSVLVVESKS